MPKRLELKGAFWRSNRQELSEIVSSDSTVITTNINQHSTIVLILKRTQNSTPDKITQLPSIFFAQLLFPHTDTVIIYAYRIQWQRWFSLQFIFIRVRLTTTFFQQIQICAFHVLMMCASHTFASLNQFCIWTWIVMKVCIVRPSKYVWQVYCVTMEEE